MKASWKTILLVAVIINSITYFSIRELLWNIVWLNKRGKLRKFSSLKKTIQQEQSIFSRVSMSYLESHVSSCHRDFIFWWKFKRFFSIAESILFFSYIGINVFKMQLGWIDISSIFMLIQALLMFFIIRLQFGLGGRLTKYDRIRMKRK